MSNTPFNNPFGALAKIRDRFPNKPQHPEALKSEHLKEGVRPIMACVFGLKHFEENTSNKEKILNSRSSSLPKLHNVDYYGDPRKLKELKFKNSGYYSYVISPVDSKDKLSKTYRDCTGIIVAGQDKETGEDISFLSHQDPEYFLLSGNQEIFFKDLIQRLDEIKDRCVEGTIDAVIVGGNYFEDEYDYDYEDGRKYRDNYLESIRLLSENISQVLGFVPAVVTGPKKIGGDDNILYDNKERRLYIVRPKVGIKSSESYSPNEIKKAEEKWIQEAA